VNHLTNSEQERRSTTTPHLPQGPCYEHQNQRCWRALVVPNAKAHRRGAVGLGGQVVVCKERGGGGAFLVAPPQIPRYRSGFFSRKSPRFLRDGPY
jgi:hypothetical protein